ncbi:MAG TPA: outer membrane beta-barrel protein, partial [Flavobacteriales bacterium]|nr:outer membrane beta-barrel protein [Flavobacteriales bacterium]
MRRYLLLFLLLLATFTGFSQTRVKGKLIDTLTDSKVPRALITIIDYKDSTLIQFTRTNAEGVFELNNMSSGKYIIMVSHPMFAGYSDELTINGQPEIDLGNIQLLSEENLLKELTVLSSDAIKIKGDTIEYTADSFKVKEGATVEDLFKKLPGIQVNKNGEIIAQGKRVEKVLVDGDEFFSDDPTVATQNLKAESVDKVQVFEKKDENSGATDQGAQTINITLKEDAKKGYFGKIKGGIGTDYDPSLANTSGYSPNTFYSNELMINKFKPRNKISAYFVHNNTGKTGLNWDESRKYGENSNINFMDEDGGFYFMTYQAEDEYENYGNKFGGQGIPLAINGGATMDRKWKKDIHHINASYQFKQIENDATSTVNSENYLSDTIFTKEENTRTLTRNQRHNFNMLYEVKTDSLATLKWTVKGNLTNNQKDNFYNAVTLNEEKDTVNTNNRVVNSSLEVMNVNTKLNWFKKFKKPERKLNLNVEYTNKNTAINSSLNSINSIYMADNMMLFNDTIDQRKTTQRVEQTLWVGISHKEPINKNAQLEFKYNFNMNNQVADRFTFDNNGDGTYTNRIDSLSSQYVYDFQSHKAGLNFHYKKNKISFKIGSDVAKQYYDQVDKLNDTTVKRDFLNFFPTSTFVYQFSKMRQFRINYNGYTTQPGIAQIQPLIDNTDPFNITIGNPNLAPSFSNDLTMMFNDNQVLKGRYFYSWANFGYKI